MIFNINISKQFKNIKKIILSKKIKNFRNAVLTTMMGMHVLHS